MTIFFKIPAQKYPNKAFLVPNLDIFIFSWNFAIDKFEGADFKCDNSFFLNSSPTRQIWEFQIWQ